MGEKIASYMKNIRSLIKQRFLAINIIHSDTLSNYIQSHTKTHKSIAFSLTQFDGNVPFQFVLETNSMHSRNGLNDRRFSMGYMTDGANVNCGLT